ncbi:S-adenosyl-L-methionine-dependent methyltransferase [Lichtheimia hyalospora FSU 10163]|nr:S-adenosyl-L-methionine-dependent methyltransferase [Lichtheimia hyalospora FSU 10163]
MGNNISIKKKNITEKNKFSSDLLYETFNDKNNINVIEGRCYETIENTSYILPNDNTEIGRLNDQHYFLRYAFNGNYKAPIKKLLQNGINVLDVGCASGVWCLDMAHEFDNCIYWGIDISEKFPNNIKPLNCNFKVGNIIKEFPLESNYFDFVHQRLLVAGIPSKDWVNTINNIKIGLKDNGWLQMVECYIKPFNAGPKFKKLMDKVIEILESKELDPYIAAKLKSMFIQTNDFININEEIIEVPISWNGKIGEMHANDWKEIYQSLKPSLTPMLPLDEKDFDIIIKEAIEECEQYKTFFKWYIVYGQLIK